MLYKHDINSTRPYVPGMELVVCNYCGEGAMGHDRGVRSWLNCYKFAGEDWPYNYSLTTIHRQEDVMRDLAR